MGKTNLSLGYLRNVISVPLLLSEVAKFPMSEHKQNPFEHKQNSFGTLECCDGLLLMVSKTTYVRYFYSIVFSPLNEVVTL